MILTHVQMCKSNSLYSVLRMDIDHSWKRSSAGARIPCPAQLDLLITHSKLPAVAAAKVQKHSTRLKFDPEIQVK